MTQPHVAERGTGAPGALPLFPTHSLARVLSMKVAGWSGYDDYVIEETPIVLSYGGVPHAVKTATPADLEDLALGFSLGAGIVDAAAEIEGLRIREESGFIGVDITLAPHRMAALRARGALAQLPTMPDASHATDAGKLPPLRLEALDHGLREFAQARPLGRQTQAARVAAWADGEGILRLVREDLDRHNALDKLIGGLCACACEPARGFTIISGRVCGETARRAIRAGLSTLVSTSAPTAQAIRAAQAAGLLLIGAARPGQLLVYTQPHRLVGAMPVLGASPTAAS
ncbi:MAG: formate dehydrogenase accessory sulfurtransferase FdhD [Candidatus Dactylopiibacterium sp.]|nr:formate dehydrogenase accessory sulfurtransferase FdhD [Candidatus Dactylopiibacterium sp.]